MSPTLIAGRCPSVGTKRWKNAMRRGVVFGWTEGEVCDLRGAAEAFRSKARPEASAARSPRPDGRHGAHDALLEPSGTGAGTPG